MRVNFALPLFCGMISSASGCDILRLPTGLSDFRRIDGGGDPTRRAGIRRAPVSIDPYIGPPPEVNAQSPIGRDSNSVEVRNEDETRSTVVCVVGVSGTAQTGPRARSPRPEA